MLHQQLVYLLQNHRR